MNDIKLDLLKDGLHGITIAFGSYMCESAIVSFMSQGHKSGVSLRVLLQLNNNISKDFKVDWAADVVAENLKSYNDENRTTDFGSMAIAVLLTLQLTEFTSFETSKTGSGIDFWLSNGDDELNFLSGARLEVSGIRKSTSTNTLDKRIKIKLEQTSKSDVTSLPAYVMVVEFGKPEGAYLKK